MIQFADKTMIEDLKLIWKECFHDPDEYINFFFENYFGVMTTLVYCIDQKPVSMLTLMPANLHTLDSVTKVNYIYAVATLPICQGKGYSSKLLEYVNVIMNESTFLQPATNQLQQFYQRNGYQVSINRFIMNFSDITIHQSELEAATLNPNYDVRELHQEDSKIYSSIRNSFFEQAGYIAWEDNVIAYAIRENEFTGGKTLLINNEYILMYRAYDGVLYIREYTMPDDMLLDFVNRIPEFRHCAHCKVYLNKQSISKHTQKEVIMSTFPIVAQDGYFNLAFE